MAGGWTVPERGKDHGEVSGELTSPAVCKMLSFCSSIMAIVRARPAIAGLLAAGWAGAWLRPLTEQGLFRPVGGDFAVYWSQARAFRLEGPAAVYDLDALSRQLQSLVIYTRQPEVALPAGPVPYPPVFAWLFTVFTWGPPPLGFALWTAVNALGAALLARRAAQLFPAGNRRWVAALVLTSFPVMYSLMLGQPMTLLAWAVGESFLALRDAHPVRAGLWASLLLFKPQYVLLLAPLLVWKGQGRVLLGFGLGGGGIVAASVLVAGFPALLAYPTAISDIAGFASSRGNAFPAYMINWRSLILALAPGIDDRTGIALVLGLGVATALIVAARWRGPWPSSSADLAGGMTAVLVATLLVSYHSHLQGLALLTVPVAALEAQGAAGATAQGAVRCLLFGSSALFLAPLTVTGYFVLRVVAWLVIVWLLLLLGSLVVGRRRPKQPVGRAVHASFMAA